MQSDAKILFTFSKHSAFRNSGIKKQILFKINGHLKNFQYICIICKAFLRDVATQILIEFNFNENLIGCLLVILGILIVPVLH